MVQPLTVLPPCTGLSCEVTIGLQLSWLVLKFQFHQHEAIESFTMYMHFHLMFNGVLQCSYSCIANKVFNIMVVFSGTACL